MVIAMLYTSIDTGIVRGQYYWELDIGCLFGIVLTLVLAILFPQQPELADNTDSALLVKF